MSKSHRFPSGAPADGCRVDIRIEGRGDVNIYNCGSGPGCGCDEAPRPEPKPECRPCRTEGACVPLGLGCKPKQSRTQKLEGLRAGVPSVLAASFFQTARRHLAGAAPATGFERAVFPAFDGLSPDLRDMLACAVDSYETTPAELRDAGLEPSILADPDKPIDTPTLAAAMVREIGLRAAEAALGEPLEPEAERPGLNRFLDFAGQEIFEAQLQICRVNDLRTATFRPPLALADYLPAEIEQTCALVLNPDGTISQNCSVVAANCPGNVLPEGVCARVLDVANGDAIVLSGVNFMTLDMTARLTALVGTANAEVETRVYGDLTTPRTELVEGQERVIRDCRVKDRATFVVPDDLPPGIYELVLAMPNVTGIASLPDVILSNAERINVLPPDTARFQIVAERIRARAETSPASFGSDEVALTILAAALLPEGTGPLMTLDRRFDDVDSGENRSMEQVVFNHGQPILGVALAVAGFEVDSERAFREQREGFWNVFYDYLKRAWDEFRSEIAGAAGAAIKALGLLWGAVAVGVAALLALGVIAVVARWAPADPIMDDALGFSVVDLAALTNVGVPSPAITTTTSPRGLGIVRTPLVKEALTYREFREYVSDAEDSRYELYLRFNRTA